MKRAAIITLLAIALLLAAPWLLPRPGLDGAIPDLPFEDSHFDEFLGVRMHWRERDGDAGDQRPLVVLLHGFGGSAYSWRHTLDALETSGFDVIAPDLPPFGYSERIGTGPDWASLVGALAERSRPGNPVYWVGHSMGAGVASRAAARDPDATGALILVGGAPIMRQRPGLLSRLSVIPSFARAAESWAAWQYVGEERIRAMLESAFGRPPSDSELREYRAPLVIPGTYPALLRRLSTEIGGPAPNQLPESTRLIWGEFDRWVPRERGDAVLRERPEFGPMRIVPESGHNPMDTHPGAFNRTLIDLFSARSNASD